MGQGAKFFKRLDYEILDNSQAEETLFYANWKEIEIPDFVPASWRPTPAIQLPQAFQHCRRIIEADLLSWNNLPDC
ncbi:MAG: hypothetical protein KC917_15800, partial [Candidatus Omnitrophica bacterium]|nr:hypothetical protein [Candidatus Omnitrophota bacterium]